ncbi:MAG: TatD family hydrolase [Acidilobaceae archaeon]
MEYIYDMHCHLYEFTDREIEDILDSDKEIVIVAVSDDLDSFYRIFDIERSYPGRVIGCVGFHPWSIREEPLHTVDYIIRLAAREGLRCIGEVGLDKRFLEPYTWSLQIEIFKRFLVLARDTGALINIHAPDAWSTALGMLIEYDISKAMFHWYTGPLDLIDVIGSRGYKISINPAIKIQEKHARVAAYTPIDYIVFESDSPYNYRGLKLSPLMIRESMLKVSELKGVSLEYVVEKSRLNSEKLIFS